MRKQLLFTLLFTLLFAISFWQVSNAQCDFTAPYTATFENAGDVDPCWIQSTTDNLDWAARMGQTSYYATGPMGAHGGDYYIYVPSHLAGYGNNGYTATIISPNIDISPLTNPYLEFYFNMYGSMDPDGTIDVDISTDGGTVWANIWTKVGTQGISWLSANVNLSAYTGTVKFRITGTISSGTYWQNDFAIDDFSVKETPMCPTPSEITVNNVLPTSATFSWLENGSASAYDIEVGDRGFVPSGTPTYDNMSSPYNWADGVPIHDYDYYVRADCGASQSAWEGPFTFTTPGTCGEYRIRLDDHNNYGQGQPPYQDASSLEIYLNGALVASEIFIYNSEVLIPTNTGDILSLNYISNESPNYDPYANEYFVYNPDGILIKYEGEFGLPSSIGDYMIPTGITACAPCADPVSLFTENMTTTSVDLTWLEVGSSTTWEVEWGVGDFVQGAGTVVTGITNTAYHLTGLTENETYKFYVRADCGNNEYSGWSDSYSFALVPPPLNDECDNALTLGINVAGSCANVTPGTVNGATQSPQSVDACYGTEDDDVWFTFVATETAHTIKLNNISGSGLSQSVWEGNCPSLTLVAGSCHYGSQIVSGLTIGNTYYLRVYSYTDEPGQTTTFDVCIGVLGPPPVNDHCADAIPIAVSSPGICTSQMSVDLSDATIDAVDGTNCQSWLDHFGVWYTWTATSEAIEFESTSGYPKLIVYEAGTCGSLVETGCLTSSGNLSGLTIGNDYIFLLWTSSYFVTAEFCIKEDQPFNDECNIAIPLTVNADMNCGTETSGTTVSATQSMAVNCSDEPGFANDVWYSFVATSTSHSVELSAEPTGGDEWAPSGYEVFSGSCNALNSLLCATHDGLNVVGGLTVGETYYLRVWSLSQFADITFTICIGTPPPPPVNDNCENAIALTVNTDGNCTTVTSGTVLGATSSPQSNYCSGTANDDVWYTFTATSASQKVELLNVQGSTTTLYYSIWEGTCPDGLTMMPGSCNGNGNVHPTTVGETYYVRVFTYSYNWGQNTTFDICVSTPTIAPPANDECGGAIALTVNSDQSCTNVTSGTVEGATHSPQYGGCSGSEDDDVWYSFTATSLSQKISLLNVQGSTTSLYFSVWEGSCPDGLTLKAYSCTTNKNTVIGTTVGQTYYVRVYTYSYTWGQNTTFDVCVNTPALPPPANDDCDGAISLTVNSDQSCTNVTSGTVEGATHSAQSESCSGTPNDDVWYSFEATSTKHKIELLNVQGNSNSLYFSVWQGTCPDGLVLKLGSCSTGGPKEVITAVGQTYFVRVHTSGGSWDNNSTFDLCVGAPAPPPANDDCDGAVNLTVNSDQNCTDVTPGTVEGATASSQLETSCSGSEDDDVWYSFTATSVTQTIKLLSVQGSTSSLYFSVWQGTCPDGLNLLAGSCTTNKTRTISTVINQTYFVRVYTSTGTPGQNTTFNVCVSTPPPPPVNDLCSGAISVTCGSTYTSNTTNATTNDSPPSCGSLGSAPGIWYTIEGDGSEMEAALCGSSFDTKLGVFSGSCGNLVCVGGNDDACGSRSRVNFSSVVGTTYYLYVTGYSSSTGATSLVVNCTTPLPNDNCSSAIPYTDEFTMYQEGQCVGTPNQINLAGATDDSGNDDPSCDASANYGVWYTWIATSTGLAFDAGSSFPGLAVYEAGTCGSLVQVGCLDNKDGVITGLTIGNNYIFYIWDDSPNANVSFCLQEFTQVANDLCSGATPYTDAFTMFGEGTCSGTPNSLDLSGATDDTGNDNPSCDGSTNYGVWYTWMATSTGLKFDTGTGAPGLAVYEAGTCGSLVQVGCLQSDGTMGGLTIGNEYVFFIWDNTPFTTVTFCLEEFTHAAHDVCAEAIDLTVGVYGTCPTNQVNVNATNATFDVGIGCDSDGGAGVWFSFVAPTSGEVVVNYSAISSIGNPGIVVYNGCGGSEVAGTCQNNPSEGLNRIVGLTAGMTYKMLLWYDSASDAGTFDICLEEVPEAPVNDVCSGAIDLTLHAGTICGANAITGITNYGTTNSGAGLPSCGNYSNSTDYGDLWYKVTIPVGATSTFLNIENLVGINTVAGALYSGACDGLTEVGCIGGQNIWPWDVTGLAVPGEIYYLRLWDNNNNQGGTFDLCGYFDTACPSASWLAVPSSSDAITATGSCVDGDWTHFYNGDHILLSLKLGGTGAVVPAAGVTIDPNGAAPDAFWVNALSGHFVDNGLGAAFMYRKWNVSPTTQPTTPVGVKFYYTGTEYDAINTLIAAQGGTSLTGHDQLRMYKVLNETDPFSIANLAIEDGQELAHGANPSISTWTHGFGFGAHIAEFEVAGFSGGGGGGASAGSPLPIELTRFVGYSDGTTNVLEWTTATERNAQYFTVEKSSDGISGFTPIGQVDAAGNSSIEINYNLVDDSPYSVSYYRLRSVDIDGSFSLSDVVVVKQDVKFEFVNLSPIPATSEVFVEFSSQTQSEVTIVLKDIMGKVLLSEIVISQVGLNKTPIRLDRIPGGTYFITIGDGVNQYTKRLIRF